MSSGMKSTSGSGIRFKDSVRTSLNFCIGSSLLASAFPAQAQEEQTHERPNIVLIYADDHVINHRANFKGIVLSARSLALHGSLDAFKERCQQFAMQFAARL